MKTSESIIEISKAMTTAWGTIQNPKHNKKVTVRTKSGGQYDFEYTDLSGIIDEVKPHLEKNGISILQQAFTEVIDNNTFVVVTTRLLHSSGEWIESRPLKVFADNNIQGMGGQITYMKRYSLSAMLGLSTEEDDDANGSLGNQVVYGDGNSNKKASDKQLEFVTSLISKKTDDKNERNNIFVNMIKELKLNQKMTEWTSQQASQAIKHLQGDAQ